MNEEEKFLRNGIAHRLAHNVMPLFIANMLGSGLSIDQAMAIVELLMQAFAEDQEIMVGI